MTYTVQCSVIRDHSRIYYGPNFEIVKWQITLTHYNNYGWLLKYCCIREDLTNFVNIGFLLGAFPRYIFSGLFIVEYGATCLQPPNVYHVYTVCHYVSIDVESMAPVHVQCILAYWTRVMSTWPATSFLVSTLWYKRNNDVSMHIRGTKDMETGPRLNIRKDVFS